MVSGLIYIVFIASISDLPKILNHLSVPPIRDLLTKSIIPSLILSLIILKISLFYPSLLIDTTKIINPGNLPYFFPLILYPLLSVPLQEIIFRWFYIGRLKLLDIDRWQLTLMTALVFGFVHLPFGRPTMFIGTFLLGLWWNWIYLKTNNLWYSLISHTLLGNTLIYLAIY